jgi:tocopherol O-methyltransferase
MNPHPDVRTYYEHTRFDYRTVWNHNRNLAVHFGYYDERATHHHAALENMNRVMADLAGVRQGEAVLDAGCGLGGACFWLATNRQARVTGISIVPRQIEDCRREARRRPADNVDFLEADYTRTPFADGSFDVVWACESVCHAADKSAFYREAWRLLKPGGRLVMAEYLRRSRPANAEGERLLDEWLRPWAISDIDTAEEHLNHALAAGFKAVEWSDVTPQVRVSLRNLNEICRKWWPWGRLLRALRLVSAIRLANVRASIRQYEALQAGAWQYGMIRAVKP